MKIEYTPKYTKQFADIKNPRALRDTIKVEKLIESAENFIQMCKLLDVKKYDPGLGGYRIRYSNKPEWRIRFELVDEPSNPREKIVKLQLVLSREDYEKYAHKSVNESNELEGLKLIISESQYQSLIIDLQNDMLIEGIDNNSI